MEKNKPAKKVSEASRTAFAAAARQVPQLLITHLASHGGYPTAWIQERIRFSDEQPATCQLFEAQLRDATPFMWFALAEPQMLASAESALRNVLLSQRIGSVGYLTDGSESRVLRRRFDSDKCEYLSTLEPFSGTGGANQQILFPSGVYVCEPGSLEPLTKRVENVFFECHSHIRDIDGLHADETLDELCKILFAKLFDETHTARRAHFVMQRWTYSSAEECAASVRALYSRASAEESKLTDGAADVFSSPIRLSSPALTRVVETLQGYSLNESATDIKGRAFQKVLGPAMRAGMGQYFTPDPVIKCMVEMAALRREERLLDPFCGSAHFLSTAYLSPAARRGVASERALAEYASTKLFGIEKSDRMVRIARTDMRLMGDGSTHLLCADSLLSFHNYPQLRPESFDVVLTNPPFGSLLSADAISKLGHFSLAVGRKTVPLEILGLERAMQFLKPGGRIGIVLPESIFSNPATSYVREWLTSQARIRAILSLPIETFAPFGANIKTSVLFARKWMPGEDRIDYSVFLGRADNVGYDAAGRTRDEPDLGAVASEFKRFIQTEGW